MNCFHASSAPSNMVIYFLFTMAAVLIITAVLYCRSVVNGAARASNRLVGIVVAMWSISAMVGSVALYSASKNGVFNVMVCNPSALLVIWSAFTIAFAVIIGFSAYCRFGAK